MLQSLTLPYPRPPCALGQLERPWDQPHLSKQSHQPSLSLSQGLYKAWWHCPKVLPWWGSDIGEFSLIPQMVALPLWLLSQPRTPNACTCSFLSYRVELPQQQQIISKVQLKYLKLGPPSSHHLGPCLNKKILASTPDLLNQNLYSNEIPR